MDASSPIPHQLVEMLRCGFEDGANVGGFGVPGFHPVGAISEPDGSIRSEIDDRFGLAVFAVSVAGFVVLRIDPKEASAEPYAAHPPTIT